MTTTPKELTKTRFGSVAERYRKSADHADVEDLDLLFSGLGLSSGHRVLDVATGGGHPAAALSGHAAPGVPSDLPPRMLSEARELAPPDPSRLPGPPLTGLVDAGGAARYRHENYAPGDEKELRAKIAELLAEK